jgi:hypothetical protein
VQVRVARHTERLDEVVAFYRDGIGLPEVGGFRGHAGYDGVFLELSGTGAHLELTSSGDHAAPGRLQGRARSRAFPGLMARTAAGCSTTGSAFQSGWPGIRGVVSP